MELGAKHKTSIPYRAREARTVLGGRNDLGRVFRMTDIGMRVIKLRTARHTVKQRTTLPRCREVGSVPADMGYFDAPALQTSHLTAQDAQSRNPFGDFTESRWFGVLVAAVKQKLHA